MREGEKEAAWKQPAPPAPPRQQAVRLVEKKKEAPRQIQPGGMQRQATKTALITGATQGIGRHTALRLAAGGAHRVLLHGRTRPQAETALRELRAELRAEAGAAAGGLVGCVHGDLADLAQVRGVADQVRAALGEGGALDVLINNAGVFANGPRRVSADGYELTYAVNVLAP